MNSINNNYLNRFKGSSRKAFQLSFIAITIYSCSVFAKETPLQSVLGANDWVSRGPNQIQGAQVEGITNSPVIGAINSIIIHPSDSNIIYIGAVNGGVWKTSNATSANPNWLPLTDNENSLSIGDIVLDPTDATSQTLVYGNGRFSSFGRRGGTRSGVFRSTNGGATWGALDSIMEGKNIVKVESRGNTILAAVNIADNFTCSNIGIYRSTDAGATFSQITNGISSGTVDTMAADPSNNAVFYANVRTYNVCGSLIDGIHKTTDSGASWTKVSNAAMDAIAGTNFEISVGNNNNVFVGVISSGQLAGMFHSDDGGSTWNTMDIPTTFENTGNVGIHPGGQGSIHFSLVADPSNDTVVYVGGDRQTRTFEDTGGFPNSIGAQNFTGRLFRGDASLALGSQWTPLTHSGTNSNSSPHADSRDMAFDVDGNLLEADDGGIYKRSNPSSSNGDWFSLNGDLAVTEIHDASLDTINDIIIGGNQDNGSAQEMSTANPIWETLNQGDGGDTAVAIFSPSSVIRYSSAQTLFGFRRESYDGNNTLTGVSFPARNVISGDPLEAQFSTPITVNNVNAFRLLFGGSNGVYESLDQGSSLSAIAVGLRVIGSAQSNMAYGASDNLDVIYVGACQEECNNPGDGDDGIFVRTSAAGAFTLVQSVGAPQGVTNDPENSNTAFYMDNATIHMTDNTGASWNNISGNIQSLNPGSFRSLKYLQNSDGDGLVIGSDNGIYLSKASDNFNVWVELGNNLPNAPIYDIDYSSTADRIMVSTLGRGAFILDNILAIPINQDVIFLNGFE